MPDTSCRPDDRTIRWWRERPCAACGHKAKSHIGEQRYCCAYMEGELYNSCHCDAFTEMAST